MSNTQLRLHHVGVVVQDISASAAWYRDHFGFEHDYDIALPGARATMIVCGDTRLELLQVDDAVPVAAHRLDPATALKTGGINHLALLVQDLDGTLARLQSSGVEVAMPPRDVPNGSRDRFAFVHDNERMLVELYQPAG